MRERARRAGLPVFDKPDSTGICFIGERPFREFLARFLPRTPGPIETADGEQLGTHQGLAFYTLGQRGGLSIGGRAGRPEEPWYVAAKDAARNALVVVQGHDHPLLASDALATGAVALAATPARREPFRAGVKVRYRQADQAARLEPRRRRHRAHSLRRPAAGRHARTVRGRLRGRALPRVARSIEPSAPAPTAPPPKKRPAAARRGSRPI